MADLRNSETVKNLMRAFAGESQARNRYTFAASAAKKEGLPVIEAVFQFTAGQEKEHAEIYYNYLKEVAGDTIHVDGGYPVDLFDKTVDLLKAARHNEYEEYDPVYRMFGDIAKDEGFSQIANTFYMIAEIEKTHGDRFNLFADLMEKNQLFVSDVSTGWMCLNCGYVYQGPKAPAACPVCRHEQGYFIRLELAPYTKLAK
ncbi:rubrerythrin family protein [Clostridium sp. MCC353]|uniref:rubrerythrin n=1 Tax=Clostridium sp. MCC353 TaxID=2592646 RepID=UPI001C0137B9|nr:rubrerythrin family protein [Clostridium sp. MCC353]MBT9774988.1 rubrerythrin family protein [Clostridium sp. MCC353]